MSRVLFFDDNYERIEDAAEKYSEDELTIVTNVPDCLRALSFHDWELVSLDHDLAGRDFIDPDDKNTGMEVVRYIEKTGWAEKRKKPDIIIHSSNFFAADSMCKRLIAIGLWPKHKPFGWKEYQKGVIAGAFDVMHVGYVRIFKEAKKRCHHLTILLHDKVGRVFEIEERKEILLSMKDVDEVFVYKTEEELTVLLESSGYDTRFVGSDHEAASSSRIDLALNTIYISRDHEWSDTYFKEMIIRKGIRNG